MILCVTFQCWLLKMFSYCKNSYQWHWTTFYLITFAKLNVTSKIFVSKCTYTIGKTWYMQNSPLPYNFFQVVRPLSRDLCAFFFCFSKLVTSNFEIVPWQFVADHFLIITSIIIIIAIGFIDCSIFVHQEKVNTLKTSIWKVFFYEHQNFNSKTFPP